MQIKGKTVVVTGAGRGIGRALARRFAGLGANLAVVDRNAGDATAAAAECSNLGVKSLAYTMDVRLEDQVAATFDAIGRDFDGLDVLVNNAGILSDSLLVKVKDGKVTGKMTLAQWQSVIDVNLTGVFLCGREAAVKMIERGAGGVIVNISSVSRHGNAGQTNYSAAKAGVASMTVVWARELARFGIRVGSIAPGFTHTEILDAMRPEVLAKMLEHVPIRRLGTPEEVAQAAQFIVENDFFSGRCVDLDGGLRM